MHEQRCADNRPIRWCGRLRRYTGAESAVGAGDPRDRAAGPGATRFCARCGRRMVVQVRPDGWWAECSRHGRVDSTEMETDDDAARAGPPPPVGSGGGHRGLTVCGAVLGAVWAAIAPSIHTVTALTKAGDRVDAFLGKESDNLFVAAAMLLGLLAMLAIVSAVLVWQWQAHRGPVLVTALWLGQVTAGAAAAGVGAVLVHWRYGTPDHQGAAEPTEPGALLHRGATGVPRPRPASDRGDTAPAGRAGRARLRADGGGHPRDDLGGWPAEHYGGRSL